MIQVSKVMNTVINKGVETPINWVANTRLLKNVCKNYQADNLKYISFLAVGSMILKDGLGCYLYVKQSLNNKDIPDDKRKFVAALDLANGGLMILAQLLMFQTISNKKVQEPIFDFLFGKHFERASKKGYQAFMKNKEMFKNITGRTFNMEFGQFQKSIKGTFGLTTTLIASTILAKRVIVPFISTPLADYAKKFLCKKGEQNGGQNGEQNGTDKFESTSKK